MIKFQDLSLAAKKKIALAVQRDTSGMVNFYAKKSGSGHKVLILDHKEAYPEGYQTVELTSQDYENIYTR